jgi:hypothetical protein
LGAQGDNAGPVHRKKQLLVRSGLHRRRTGIAVPYHHNHCLEADGERQVSTDLTIVFFAQKRPPPSFRLGSTTWKKTLPAIHWANKGTFLFSG